MELNSTENEGMTKEGDLVKPMCWDNDSANCKKETFSKSIPSSQPKE